MEHNLRQPIKLSLLPTTQDLTMSLAAETIWLADASYALWGASL